MAPEYYYFFNDLVRFELPKELNREVSTFWKENSDYNQSNSKVGHIADGWFMIYDYPSAEHDATQYMSSAVKSFTDTSYHLVHFQDIADMLIFKLKWC
jgi:hypothetical protein